MFCLPWHPKKRRILMRYRQNLAFCPLLGRTKSPKASFPQRSLCWAAGSGMSSVTHLNPLSASASGRKPQSMPAQGTKAFRWYGAQSPVPAGWWWTTLASTTKSCAASMQRPSACCAMPLLTPSSTVRCSIWTIFPLRCPAAMVLISAGITG